MGGDVLEEVGASLRVAQVGHGDELQAGLLAALVMGAQHHARDPSEFIDGHFDHLSKLLTTATMFSAVKTKCLKTSAAGADSPKRSMPTTAPSRPTYLRQ